MGTEDAAEYEACGTTRRRRVSRTEEAIEVMRLLWKEDNVTFHGQHFTLNDVTVMPKPVFPPDGMPPIWIGGRSEPALRRTARIGDGWLVSQATPDEVRDGVDKISTWAVEYGNDIEEDHYGVLTSFFIDDDPEEAERIATPHMLRRREDVHWREFSSFGRPEVIRELIDEYIDAGAEKFVMRPCMPARADAGAARNPRKRRSSRTTTPQSRTRRSRSMPDYTTRVGNVEILALSDGSIRFTPADFFPTIPAEAWDPYREYFTPEGEMIMNLGCFLLRSEGKTILIDTGLGIDTGHLDTLDKGKLLDDFSAKGVSRDEVDVVGITHLHIDHVGWNFLYDDGGDGQESEVERSGEPRATFSNARYWVANADWRVFTRGALRKRPYIPAQVLPLQDQGILELFEGEQQITGEVSTLPTPGHTPGHTSFLVASQGERAVITGDAIHFTRPDGGNALEPPRRLKARHLRRVAQESAGTHRKRQRHAHLRPLPRARLRHPSPHRRPPLLAGHVEVGVPQSERILLSMILAILAGLSTAGGLKYLPITGLIAGQQLILTMTTADPRRNITMVATASRFPVC